MPDTFTTLTESQFPQRIIENAAGVRVSVLANGCLQWITVGPTMINLFVGQPLGGGPMRLLLRKHEGDAVRFIQAVGPESTAEVAACENAIRWVGQWDELNYTVELILHDSEPAWTWRITLDTNSQDPNPRTYDAILVQDVGLADRGQIQNNEAYTSQYLDHQIFDHAAFGPVIATRQNLAQHGKHHPQLLTACLDRAAGALTDAFDFFGPAARAGYDPLHATTPTIPTRNRQYEFSCHVLQAQPIKVVQGSPATIRFVAHALAHHPGASHAQDTTRLDAFAGGEVFTVRGSYAAFTKSDDPAEVAPLLNGRTLSKKELEDQFGEASLWRHVEEIDGELASFFTNHREHVVLPNKELAVDRRHAHLIAAGHQRLPGGETMCNTAYMAGVFASHVCLGNTSFNKLLSVSRDPLNLARYSGMRLLVREPSGEDGWRPLGCPSTFRMGLGFAVWDYVLEDGRRVIVTSSVDTVLSDDPDETSQGLRFIVIASGGDIELRVVSHLVFGDREHDQPITVSLDQETGRATCKTSAGMIGERYPDAGWSMEFLHPAEPSLALVDGGEFTAESGTPAGLPYLVADCKAGSSFLWKIVGTLGGVAGDHAELTDRVEAVPGKSILALEPQAIAGVARLDEALPWFDHNASIHLTAPHGIEQYGGAAWGVRDVCQGPVEWLLARGEAKTVERILEDVFSHQYQDTGAWPQWYMHPPFENIQSDHSHGDVAVWPIIAAVNLLSATGDLSWLDRPAAWTVRQPPFPITSETATIREHVEFAIQKLIEKFVPGTSLLSYGDGDWNDSLQPARPEMRESMVSTWTVELFYQALRGWARVCRARGEDATATAHDATADAIRADFNERLVLDDETVGLYMHDEQPEKAQVLLHPRDNQTGVKHRLLPMIRGIISGIFTPEQAVHHAALIETHLLAPDGARLMDRPPKYTGGTMTHFQRLESASFFGREIGLMYTHAHLRYAEAMAKLGHPRKLFEALEKINPVGIQHAVPNANPRQANCYFSSSDAAFLNRADSEARYDELMKGNVPVNGGWRVYSSGPGIVIGLIVRQWLGLRRDHDRFVFDPVLMPEHDGLIATVSLLGETCEVTYHVSGKNEGVQRVTLDGEALDTVGRDANPYRVGGLCVDAVALRERLAGSQKRIEVWS